MEPAHGCRVFASECRLRIKAMRRSPPLFADAKTAAALFCMKRDQFQRLVEQGHLPGPRNLGGLERWDVEELRKIARGDALDGGGMTW